MAIGFMAGKLAEGIARYMPFLQPALIMGLKNIEEYQVLLCSTLLCSTLHCLVLHCTVPLRLPLSCTVFTVYCFFVCLFVCRSELILGSVL